MKRLKVITSYAGHARFIAELSEEPLGYIPRTDIPSPYAFSPTHAVYDWDGRPTITVETRHKRYEVFLVPPYTKIYPTDEAATDIYIAAHRRAG